MKRGRLIILSLTIAVFAAMSLTGCSGAADKDVDVIGAFVKEINENSSNSDIHASVENDVVVLTLKLEDTPRNRAKIYMLRHLEEPMDAFEKKITASLGEGHFLARMVKEKKNLAFRVAAGGESFTLIYNPQHIREIAFKNQ